MKSRASPREDRGKCLFNASNLWVEAAVWLAEGVRRREIGTLLAGSPLGSSATWSELR